MAQLKDMEELLQQIEDSEIKDYMKEAMSCYYANAYRGCVVLSIIAMFEDLMRKLKELSYINGKALNIYKLLLIKQEDQDVFENEMLEQLCSNNIISKLEKDIFTNLKTLRHKSAHPSGHKPSSEEARYVFSEVILKVLTQPLLKTIHLIEEILKKLNTQNYFPILNDIKVFKLIVKDEITKLDENAFAMLIEKLILEIKDSAKNEKINQKIFIYGLSIQSNSNINKYIYTLFIKKYLTDLNFKNLIPILFTIENKMLEYIKEDIITQQRLNSMLISKIDEETSIETAITHSYNFFKENSELIKEYNLYNSFKLSIEKFIVKYEYSFPKEILVFDGIKNQIIDKYKNNAKSSSFTISNDFVEKYKYIDSFINLEPFDAFEICRNIKIAADSRSFISRTYYNDNFDKFPKLKASAKEYINSLPNTTGIDGDLIQKINHIKTEENIENSEVVE